MTAQSSGFIETLDPRTGKVIARVPDHSAEDVAAAVFVARDNQRAWSALPFSRRAEHLLAVRDLMLDRAESLVEVICSETGKLPSEAVMTELFATAELIQHYARHGEKILGPQKVSTGMMITKKAYVTYSPLGVVGVISPWNYPFVLTMTPIVSALLAGNTVVFKPSEITPLVGLEVAKLFAEVGDYSGIVTAVTGGGSTGDALVRSGVDKVCFTGSVATGKKVMAAAAETLTSVTLELGGKDPMIVCDDADMDRAVGGALWSSFSNSGQTCMATERVYVDRSRYEEFTERVVEATRKIRQGTEADGDIGSMTFADQVEIVERHVADAVAKGAKVLTGGRRISGREGLWYEPTVLTGVDHSMDIMKEETFGPVMMIMPVDGDDEAVRLANDSMYGLNSSVWTTDPARGRRIADRIEAGNVCVNDSIVSYAVTALPFGGVKESGIGRVHGDDGLRTFCESKSVLVDRFGTRREPWWFPVPKGFGKQMTRVLRLRYRRGIGNKLKALLPHRPPR